MRYPKVKAKRVELGLTQTDVANDLGLSLTSYCFKERGIREFNSDEIIKLLHLFECKFEDIFLQ